MAMATSSAAVGSATGHTVAPTAHLQFQESFNLKRSHLFFPLSKCGALSTSSTKHCNPRRTQRRPKSILPVRAVASTQESTENESITKTTKYHFLVANAKFMLDEEEHFQELMREKLRNFEERKREQDFWLVIEPKFLENFPDITKRLRRPAVALVSTDELWITFMKLRLDRVLRGEIEAVTLAEALKSDSVDLSFEKPQTWTAPYTKYTGSWWIPFLPPQEL